ncbi:MAG: hypothetical protein HYR64_02110 [Fimbriimonas ginsengisoli]|uniref:Uncharacterized protein n=1 Tax=Fimbriimonas ginsengisoli TaxID=1005039 RepID=A0A931LRB2_FIMGI|nr:hypothetical protein [Fimbriimonas ginsengisoli]
MRFATYQFSSQEEATAAADLAFDDFRRTALPTIEQITSTDELCKQPAAGRIRRGHDRWAWECAVWFGQIDPSEQPWVTPAGSCALQVFYGAYSPALAKKIGEPVRQNYPDACQWRASLAQDADEPDSVLHFCDEAGLEDAMKGLTVAVKYFMRERFHLLRWTDERCNIPHCVFIAASPEPWQWQCDVWFGRRGLTEEPPS